MDSCDAQIESATTYRAVLFESTKSLLLLFFALHIFSIFRSSSSRILKVVVSALLALVAIHSGSSYAVLFFLLRCRDGEIKFIDGLRVLTEFTPLPAACALVYYILITKYVGSSKIFRISLWMFAVLAGLLLLTALFYEIGTLITLDALQYLFILSILLSAFAIVTSIVTITCIYRKTGSFQCIFISVITLVISAASIVGTVEQTDSSLTAQFISLLLVLKSTALIQLADSKTLPVSNNTNASDFGYGSTPPTKTTIPRNRLSVISVAPPSQQALNEMLNQKTIGNNVPITAPASMQQRIHRNNSITSNSISFSEINLNETEHRPKQESAASNAAKLAKRRSTLILDQKALSSSEFRIPSSRSPSPTETNMPFGSSSPSSNSAANGQSNRAKRMSTYLSYPPSSM